MNELLREVISYILEKGEGKRKPREVGTTWQTDSGNWSAKSSKRTQGGFDSEEAAEAWLAGKGPSPGEDTTSSADKQETPPSAQKSKKVAGTKSGSGGGAKPKVTPAAGIVPSVGSDATSGPSVTPSVGTNGADTPRNNDNLASIVKSGFKAPGNDFSKYQEAVSISTATYIVENPSASDEEIISELTKLDCGSKTLTSKVTAKIPRRFAAQYKKIKDSGAFSTGCSTEYSEAQNRARFMTMVVAKAKASRMQKAIQTTGLSDVNIDAFSGDQQSLAALSSAIEGATGKFYSETGQELSKEEVLEYISGFGTAKFPADTALVGRDASGNIILVGFSDKKDLSAIINNSTVTKDIERTKATLDSLLKDEKITEEQHRQVTSEITELSRDYEKAEEELKEVTSSPANKLVETAEANPAQLKKLIAKAKKLSTGGNPQKYWDERIGKFQRAAGKKATEANEQENLQWLRKAGWDGKSKVSDEMAMTAFGYKCQDVLTKGEEDLPKDDQEVLFRLGIVDPTEMVARIGQIRKNALQILTDTRAALDKVQVAGLPLGTFIDGVRAWKGLHLDMRDYKGTLSMVAEDSVVDFKAIEDCLGGIPTLTDFAKNLKITTRDIKSREYGIVTGASVEVFSFTPAGDKVNVGVRSIRSKDGILGRLQTTWTYHPEFQDCLGGKKG
jgi:hypothetical protein